MQPPWFYCPNLHTGELTLDAAEARHILKSRRLRTGDTLTLFDGAGRAAEAKLLGSEADTNRTRPARARDTLVRVDRVDQVPRSERELTLIVPGCKGARLDWLVEKCTELGVTRLILANFERSIVRIRPSHVEKLRRTAIEACKQCRRAYLPQIAAGVSLPEIVAAANPIPLLVAHPSPDAQHFSHRLADACSRATQVRLVIGPEGGLTDAELDLLRRANGAVVRLSEHILRIETAAIAVAAYWAL